MTKVRIEIDESVGTATVWNDDESYTLYGVHREEKCSGDPCVLHNPSDHDLRDWSLQWIEGGFVRVNTATDEGRDDPDVAAFRKARSGPRIKCLNCHSVIQSTHRHDFVTCKCGATSIDGGGDYTRILGSQWGFFSHPDAESVQ
jgi:hypothetical protein